MLHQSLLLFGNETATEQASGIGALGLNLQSFIFQLITFVLVVLFLKKYALDKLYAVIDDRRNEILAGLERAEKANETLKEADEKAQKIITGARGEAEVLLKDARLQAVKQANEIEAKAQIKAQRIIEEAHEQLAGEIKKAEKALLAQTARLVADATAKVVDSSLSEQADQALIERRLAEVENGASV